MSCIGGDLNDNGVGVNAVSNAGVTDPVAGRVGYPVLCTLVINVKDRTASVGKSTHTFYGFNSTIGSYGTIASGEFQIGSGRTVARSNRLPTLNQFEENDSNNNFFLKYANATNTAEWNTFKVTNESASTFTLARTTGSVSFGSNTWTYSSFTDATVKNADNATVTFQLRAD